MSEDSEPRVDESVVVVDALELVGLLVEGWQSVSRAMHDSNQLGDAEHEVDQLRNEEEHHRFAEVS